jgi:hypothetical protein
MSTTGKKRRAGDASSQPEWQEGAGSLLLLAAAQQTELLPRLQAALSPNLLATDLPLRLSHSQPATLRRQLLTLLFLEAVGLRRTWDLRGYTGQALALLTNRHRAYSYRHTERFLAELASVGADAPLTEALACWTASLWEREPQERDDSVSVRKRSKRRRPELMPISRSTNNDSGKPTTPATKSSRSARSTAESSVNSSYHSKIWNNKSGRCTNWTTTKIR